jgi:phage/plasmid-associated DNA primase
MAWIEEAVSPKPGSSVTRKAVYARYREWCRDNGRSAVSTKKFWPRFREVLADQGVVYEEAKNAQDERAVIGLSVAGTAF